jgi:hypothetical protein
LILLLQFAALGAKLDGLLYLSQDFPSLWLTNSTSCQLSAACPNLVANRADDFPREPETDAEVCKIDPCFGNNAYTEVLLKFRSLVCAFR